MTWFGGIFDADESESEDPVEGNDGNYYYSNGTYGQSDYTVRERSDGTYDVYVSSDSDRGHSHDHIDSDGNLLDSYHDFIFDKIKDLSNEELELLKNITEDEMVLYVINELKSSSKKLILK